MLDKIRSPEPSVNMVQDRVEQALRATPGAIQSGRLLSALTMVSGTPQTIAHLLGRPPVGAFPVLASAAARYKVTAPTTDYITLEVDANGTYSFWVF